jgi:hypothetical protein
MWRPLRNRWVATIVGLQLAVPAAALVVAPSQFGFQMYSGAGWTRIQMEDADGQVHDLAVATYVAKPRIDIDWTARLPERICEVETDAVKVTVERWRSRRSLTCP